MTQDNREMLLEMAGWSEKRAAEASSEFQIAREKWRRDQLLGEHRAYMAMRSYVAAALRAHATQGRDSDG